MYTNPPIIQTHTMASAAPAPAAAATADAEEELVDYNDELDEGAADVAADGDDAKGDDAKK